MLRYERMFGLLEVGIRELAALDSSGFADGELSSALVELARLRASLEAAEAGLSHAWDARRVWAADGARSGAAWLARETRNPKSDCRRRIALGRTSGQLPFVAEAWSAGNIDAAHVRRLGQARNHRTAHLMARDEQLLLAQAMALTFAEFTQVVDYWSLHADPDGAADDAFDRIDRRRVSLDETLSGMWSGAMLFDPINGTIVAGELERLEKGLFDAEWASVKARLGHDPKIGELDRTPDQRRADALVEMAKRSATMPTDGKQPKPLFTLLLGSDMFRRLTQLASGQVVAPEAILPWTGDADLERILFEGGPSRVIDVSYKRAFTGALRRLIEVRDRSCYHRTCDEPASRCQVDHIEPWIVGGITSQENGRLACGYHNRLRHRRRGPPPAP